MVLHGEHVIYDIGGGGSCGNGNGGRGVVIRTLARPSLSPVLA
jgi:hypothetical protein